jgi:hypothetical protein
LRRDAGPHGATAYRRTSSELARLIQTVPASRGTPNDSDESCAATPPDRSMKRRGEPTAEACNSRSIRTECDGVGVAVQHAIGRVQLQALPGLARSTPATVDATARRQATGSPRPIGPE